MMTLTTFDQGDEGDSGDIYGSTPDTKKATYFSREDTAGNKEEPAISFEIPAYVPYITAGDAEFEPIEVLDEEPRWESYFSGMGRPDSLIEDPYEEAGFLSEEKLLPGKKMVGISPRKKAWPFIGLRN